MVTALIVEDSLTDLEIFRSYLKQNGFNVLTANNGSEALEKISSNQLDLIVLDVVLPDRSGFEICRTLKNEANTSQIPVIICSTKDTEMDKFWALKQGADAYLYKPVDHEELLKIIKQLVKG